MNTGELLEKFKLKRVIDIDGYDFENYTNVKDIHVYKYMFYEGMPKEIQNLNSLDAPMLTFQNEEERNLTHRIFESL